MRESHHTVYRIPFLTALFAGMCLFLVPGGHAEAQSGLPVAQAEITTSPSFPGPNESFTASLNAYAYDLNGATIRWFVNGEEVSAARDSLTLEGTMGELGSSLELRVSFTPGSGDPMNITRTLVASEVDLIIEADTSVPSFYRGRALGGDGASLRAVAVPHVAGTARDADLFYTWTLGNQVLFGGTTRGRQAAELQMPSVPKVLSVSVSNANGTELGRKAVRLSPHETELYFYEDNPLRGMSRRAVGNSMSLVGEETIVRAEPYFVSNNVTAGDALYTWRINGVVTDNPSGDPRSITLRKTGGGGSAEVGFEFMNEQAVLQRLRGTFMINFE